MSKTAQENKAPGTLSWGQEQPIRQKMAQEIRTHILDPFALISSWLHNLDAAKHYTPDYDELGRLLALLVMGAHHELDMHCSYGGHFAPPLSDCLESELKGGAV